MLTPAPAAAAIVTWEYFGTVSSNFTQFGGVSLGDAVSMTMLLDTSAHDVYSAGAGLGPEACGLYSVPAITISFGSLVYRSTSSSLTINTPAAPGNCGSGPSQDGFVLVGAATGPSPGPLDWRIYAEIPDVPLSDHIPMTQPLGAGVFLDLAYGFFPQYGAQFAMTANLTARAPAPSFADVPEPATLGLALIGLTSLGLRRFSRRWRG